MRYISQIEYVTARILIKTLGTRVGLQIYSVFASDHEVPSTGPFLLTQQIHQPPAYDLSHWKTVTDWYNIQPHPLLMGTKATQGTSYKDPTFVDYFTNFKTKVQCKRLAYHYFEKTMDPVAQANWFLNFVNPYLELNDVLALDFEQGGETASQLWAFMNRLDQVRPRNLKMFYSRKNLADPISMTNAEKEFFKSKPFWTAGYPTYPENYTTTPPSYIPDQSKWGPVWLWQYTDQGPVIGITNGADTNLIEPPFITWLGGEIEQPPDQGGTVNKTGKVVTASLNIRARPDDTNNTTNPPIGSLMQNDIVTSDQQTPTNWWTITSITRGGGMIMPPAQVCWASAGTTTIYIQEIVTPPPTNPVPPQKVTVANDDGSKWESTSFTRVP